MVACRYLKQYFPEGVHLKRRDFRGAGPVLIALLSLPQTMAGKLELRAPPFPDRQVSQTPYSDTQAPSQGAVAAQLQTLIPRLMDQGRVPGVAAALIQNGKIVWNHSFGHRNPHDFVNDDTVFEAASLSKPVFTYAVLKLVDQRKIDLDTPLATYLPGTYVTGDDRSNAITARMVLAHTTGLANEVWPPNILKLYFDPGSRFSYSGEGFYYLQHVVEHISGQQIEEFVQETVLQPLGMSHSSYGWRPTYSSEKACGATAAGEFEAHPFQFPFVRAYSTLETTSLDYAKFVVALLHGKGLSTETFKQMMSPQVHVDESCFQCVDHAPGKLSPEIAWGLGIGLETIGGRERFWHWGDNRGRFQSFMIGSVEKGEGLIILTNSGRGLSIVPSVVNEVFDGKHPEFDWLRIPKSSGN
jgi:CubicO group peptidase (beta-lactamase class C family)